MTQHLFDKPIHLSELHIQRNGDSFFLFGQALAIMNAGGYYYYPNLFQSLRFKSKTGNLVIGDFENLQTGELDPEVASWQFLNSMPEDGLELIRGMLGGYVRKAYQIIDPKYPGFTDKLLHYLVSPRVLSATKPRELRLQFGQVLANYGFTVHFDQTWNKPKLTPIQIAQDPPPDLELILTTIVISLAEMDTTQWIKQVEAIGNDGEMAAILGAICRQEHRSTWDGIAAKILGLGKAKRRLQKKIDQQPIPIRLLLIIFEGLYTLDELPENGQFDLTFEMLKVALKEMLPHEPLERIEYLEALMDGMDFLAQAADQQGAVNTSIRKAQITQILMQLIFWDKTNVGGMEERLSLSEVVEKRYSWYHLSVEPTTDKYIYYNYLNFSNSASLADLGFFDISRQLFAQNQTTNLLWTAIWRALDRQRKALKLVQATTKLVDLKDDSEVKNYTFVFESNLKTYLRCLKTFGEAIGSTIKDGEPTSNYFHLYTGEKEKDQNMFLSRESVAVLNLYDHLKANGLNQSTLVALNELITIIDEC